ncbi:MAG: hypothetical protein KAS66_10650 [Candidatus Omnitrophica bacterium]|nr:hypothetical protein [Candidatus Omnitrophota bacterium]
MRTSIPSTGTNDGSPCRTCPNHFAGINKELCLNACKRLAAYHDGKDWRGMEVFVVSEGKDLVEDVGAPDVPIDLEVVEEVVEDLGPEIDQDKLPEVVTHITPETNWKKTMPKKLKTEKPIQDICIMDGCDQPAERRDCCLTCYQRWRRGTIDHPTIGTYRNLTRPEKAKSRSKKAGKRSIVDKSGRQALPTGGYRSSMIIEINFNQYEYLYSKIRGEAVRLSLPVSHVIMTMLGEASAINGNKKE